MKKTLLFPKYGFYLLILSTDIMYLLLFCCYGNHSICQKSCYFCYGPLIIFSVSNIWWHRLFYGHFEDYSYFPIKKKYLWILDNKNNFFCESQNFIQIEGIELLRGINPFQITYGLLSYQINSKISSSLPMTKSW